MYNKRCTGRILVRMSLPVTEWVKWVHHSEGKTHCETCLQLDGCFFTVSEHPPCPHHPHCHCTLEPIDYETVLSNASVYSDYRKYDPYLFNTYDTPDKRDNGKADLFMSWGYTVADAKWLQAELERQAKQKHIEGDYKLGKLNENGQRISIRVSIPRKDDGEMVSFITGWMAEPNGRLRMTTPYGGK